MKRMIIGVVCSLLAITAFAKDPVKDPKCEQVGQFAKGIATIKLAGYDMNALSAFVSEPKAQTFPLQIVKQQIYDQNIAPDPAYAKFYGQCVAVGYDVLFEYFAHEQERQQLAIDNTSLKAENAALRTRENALQRQVTDMQVFYSQPKMRNGITYKPTVVVPPDPPAPQVKAYGAPINEPIVHH